MQASQMGLWSQLVRSSEMTAPIKAKPTIDSPQIRTSKGSRAFRASASINDVYVEETARYFSHVHIKPLFEKLKQHESLLKLLDKETSPIVFKGDYQFIEGLMFVKVSVFKIRDYEQMDLQCCLTSKYIKASVDWIDNNILWFRRTPTGYESFIDYIDEYRDHFVVDGIHPILELTLSLPESLQ